MVVNIKVRADERRAGRIFLRSRIVVTATKICFRSASAPARIVLPLVFGVRAAPTPNSLKSGRSQLLPAHSSPCSLQHGETWYSSLVEV